MNFPLLSTLIFLPALAGLVLLSSHTSTHAARKTAFAITLLDALITLAAIPGIKSAAGFAFEERHHWLPAIGLDYHLAADGISLAFLLLTSAVFVMSLLASRSGISANRNYYGLILLLQSGLFGTFVAQNFLHFFLFWELSLIPAFFLIKDFGGHQRSFAATQFFLYTMLGSIAMLLGFLALYLAAGTLNFSELAAARSEPGFALTLQSKLNWTGLSAGNLSTLVFLLAFAGIAVKVPLWPLHSWQPIAYVEAPTPVTMALTGIMSKMGVYALIRLILPIFPSEISRLHQPLLALAVVTILYGAWAAFAQRDIKRLFAYSSLSHLGYCFLGIFAAAKASAPTFADDRAAAVNGVILQALSHGVIAAALFAFISFLESRTSSRAIEDYGGLRKVNPAFAGFMGVALFASLGLPGLSGFPAEFLIFKGAFSFAPVACSVAVLGLLLTALYILTFFGRVFYGPLTNSVSSSPDLSTSEKLIVLPAIAAALLLGIAPQLLIQLFNGPVTRIVQGLAI